MNCSTDCLWLQFDFRLVVFTGVPLLPLTTERRQKYHRMDREQLNLSDVGHGSPIPLTEKVSKVSSWESAQHHTSIVMLLDIKRSSSHASVTAVCAGHYRIF